jgi:hypothetical protein
MNCSVKRFAVINENFAIGAGNPQIVEKRFVGCSPHKALPMLKRRFRQYHLFERMPDGSVRETKRQLMGFTLIVRPIIQGHCFDI